MKISDFVFIVGFGSFLLGACGYDSNPVIGFIVGIIGLVFAWTGYRLGAKK